MREEQQARRLLHWRVQLGKQMSSRRLFEECEGSLSGCLQLRQVFALPKYHAKANLFQRSTTKRPPSSSPLELASKSSSVQAPARPIYLIQVWTRWSSWRSRVMSTIKQHSLRKGRGRTCSGEVQRRDRFDWIIPWLRQLVFPFS